MLWGKKEQDKRVRNDRGGVGVGKSIRERSYCLLFMIPEQRFEEGEGVSIWKEHSRQRE